MRNNRRLHSLYLFLQAIDSFSWFHPISGFHGKRKKEFGIKHLQRKPLTTTTTCVRCRVPNWLLCLLCNILFFFSKRKCISKSWRKLMNYTPENRIPWLFTDFENIKDFPWLFPYLEEFSFFLDFSLTMATLSQQFALQLAWLAQWIEHCVWSGLIPSQA